MGLVWPFPTKSPSMFHRVDEGQDLQYPGTQRVPIRAAASGTVEALGPDPNGFGNEYPGLVLDKPVDGFNEIYYGHVSPIPGVVGQHVKAGQVIAMSGGSTSNGDAAGTPNWLEMGFWPPSYQNGPAMAKALGNSKAPTSTTTTSSKNCPSILSDPVGWATCNALGGSSNPLAQFMINPVDAMERVGLVLLGAFLILLGVAILGFGPATRVLGMAAGTSRDVRAANRLLGGSSSSGGSGPSDAVRAERAARLDLAERNATLGERKQQFREDRERRLAMGAEYRHRRHTNGREPNPSPKHSS